MNLLYISFILIFAVTILLSTSLLIKINSKKYIKKNRKIQENQLKFYEKIIHYLKSLLPLRFLAFQERLISKASYEKFNIDKLLLIQFLISISTLLTLQIFSKLFIERPVSTFIVSVSFGTFAPLIFIFFRARDIQYKLTEEIPFFADLLTLSCEAGLDIFASLHEIIGFLERKPLRNRIEAMLKDVKMGKSRQVSLRHAYCATDSWDLKTIFLTISQAENLGTPIGKSLRNQIEIMRSERLNRAEKHAQEAPLKLMIPLLLCIFPVTLMTLVSPIVLRFLNGEIL